MSEVAELEPQESEREPMSSMSFLEHLEELRTRIFHSLAAIAVGMGVCWWFHQTLFTYMQKPITDVLRQNGLPQKLVYLTPAEPFNLYLKISALAGLFLTSPYVLYQVWLFISPGLYRKEKKYAVPFMISTIFLFAAGGYFGYRMVYPAALKFLIGIGNQFTPMITIHEYTDLFLTVILGLGLVFEMPILIFFLALMGVVSAGWMWRNIRYGILVIFIIAGALAPTPDISSMCIFAAPMVALYLVSIGVAWFVHPEQRQKREARKRA
ncbi:MAG TPA: twin-arginine translocase subunit TatC [Terriglobales bacterium]|jgi:sec-independent protein translocase protein TatC|nr:twin-arginine translocase subunit TatC [Terriglobales bacterium]